MTDLHQLKRTPFHRAHRRALPAAELAALGRAHRGRLLRPRRRARVLGDPQPRGADRRLAADEVPDRGPRRRAAARSGHAAQHRQARRRTGVLHRLVRRRRQAARRRHRDAPGRAQLPPHLRRTDAALAAHERGRHGRDRHRAHRTGGRALAAGTEVARGAESLLRDAGGRHQVLPHGTERARRQAGDHLAHRLHRRPRLRDLAGRGGCPARLGCAARARQ